MCITRRLGRNVVDDVYGDNEMANSDINTGTVRVIGKCGFATLDGGFEGMRTSARLSNDQATEIATNCPRTKYAHTCGTLPPSMRQLMSLCSVKLSTHSA